jgi:putative DNA primase/helicase
LLGNIQPARLRWFLSDAVRGGPGDDGLFQRFQVMAWPDPPRSWKLVDRPPNARAVNAFERVCRALSALSADCPIELRFSMEAQEFFFGWWTKLEERIRCESGLNTTIIAHLSKYRSLMPTLAGLFELADTAASDRPLDHSFIDIRHAENAAAVCAYLESHAGRIYSCLVAPELEAAHELARHIRGCDLPSEFTMRTVYRKSWARLDSPERVQAVLAILEDANWVRPKRLPPGTGRPPEIWELNPLSTQGR